MAELVFEKGVVTFTFLVTIPPHRIRDDLTSRYKQDIDALPDEDKAFFENPQVLAEMPVQDLFRDIIERTRPQGVVVQIGTLHEEDDAARIAPLRQKVKSREIEGHLVTVRIGFTRDKSPFPGLGWLLSQVHEHPTDGITLLYTEAVQVPA